MDKSKELGRNLEAWKSCPRGRARGIFTLPTSGSAWNETAARWVFIASLEPPLCTCTYTLSHTYTLSPWLAFYLPVHEMRRSANWSWGRLAGQGIDDKALSVFLSLPPSRAVSFVTHGHSPLGQTVEERTSTPQVAKERETWLRTRSIFPISPESLSMLSIHHCIRI